MLKLLCVSLFFVPKLLWAQQACENWQENKNYKTKLIIKRIDLQVGNIFDLKQKQQSKAFHKIANKLHVITKQSIVKRELLFQEGDVLDVRLLAETERFLRAKPYIKDAHIEPTQVCGNEVTVAVVTRDNWTLTPGISYGRTGGVSKYTLELQEKNLFGLGKSLEFKYKKGLDRTQKSIKYNDDNLFGTRNRLDAIYEDNSDGKLKFINYYHPFFSLDSDKSWGVRYFDNQRITPLYDFGIISDEIGQDRQVFTLKYGRMFDRSSTTVQRYTLGFTSDKSRFYHSDAFPDTQIPSTRNYTYAWLGYEFFQENYIKRTNFNRMGRIEDVSLGNHLFATVGLGNNSDFHYYISYSRGLMQRQKDVILLQSFWRGIKQKSQFINNTLNFNLKWHHWQSDNRSFFAALDVSKSHNLFAERRNYLGGDTGLRGYPLRYLNGDNRYLLTLEQRFFHHWYPLKTVKFATAVFLDSGSAWNNGQDHSNLTNVGIGLRMVPTRTSSGQIIHMDFAYPLNKRGGIVDSWQFQLRTKHTF